MMKKTYLVFYFAFVALVYAQNLISVDTPKANDTIKSREVLNIAYSVIGSQTMNPPVNSYYPSSLTATFAWTERANQSNTISFNAIASLKTNPYPGGTQTVQHKESWRVPGCHFFSRYPPSSFDFSLTFIPVYSESETMGTPQDAIIVPLSVNVDNSTFPKC